MNPEDLPDSDEEIELMNISTSKNLGLESKIGNSNSVKENERPNIDPIPWDEINDTDFPDFEDNLASTPNLTNQLNKENNSNLNNNSTQNTQGRKRTFEELVRDVDNLIQETGGISNEEEIAIRVENNTPRWDEPAKVIDAILKKKRRMQLIADSKTAEKTNSNNTKDKQLSISNRIPQWDDFVALTRGKDSKRLYIKVRPDLHKTPDFTFKSSADLLSTKYNEIKEKAHVILAKKIERSENLIVDIRNKKNTDNVLWVDKYRPKSYIELLSDETVNRNFLHWIKLWDKVVFNREPIKKEVQSKRADVNKSWKSGKKFDFNFSNKAKETVDKNGIPIHRIVLLHGPPGLGKTTLAHLVAKHAGYNVVEINASNDRNPEAFKEALLSSTQMQSMIGKNPRPNCLVLDEIDGAPPASIELLIKFVQGKLTSKKRKGKSVESSSCKRPIVCICNELYTMALRPLRNISYIINVPKITAQSLADRLMTIARKENIYIHHCILLQLAENSGCDIRSCLLTLQFRREKCGQNSQFGDKDSKKGIFEFWKGVLQVPMERTGPLSIPKRVQIVLRSTNCDNSERLAQGVFENYLANCPDKIDKISFSVNWFGYFDKIVTIVKTINDWRLMPYLNYAFVAWHLGFAASKPPKLSYPFTAIEMNQKIDKNKAIVVAVQRSCGQDSKTIILDHSPFIRVLLSPRLRSVVRTLYSPKEKCELERLINIMLDYGLTFVQEKTEQGTMDYILEPNLFNIGIFPDCNNCESLSYAIKQIVFKELQDERLKRAMIINDSSKSTDKQSKEKLNSTTKVAEKNNSENPSHLTTLNPIVIQPNATKVTDFFANFRRPKSNKPVENNVPKVKRVYEEFRKYFEGPNVHFKYNEGFCNAIRRTLLMEDLL